MAAEAFLINPVRRKRKRARKNIWTGHSKKHRRAAQVGWSSRKVGIKGYAKRTGATYPRYNPLEEGVLILGNPRRRRRRRVRRNVLSLNRPRRRVRRRRVMLYNAPRRRYRRRRRSNLPALYNAPAPVRRYSRRRRNPVARRYRRRISRVRMKMRIEAINLRRPQTIVLPILVGVAAKIATDKIPDMMKLTGNQKILGQLGVAVGGGFLMGGITGPIGATIWIAVSASGVLANYVSNMIAQIQAPTVEGIGYPAGYGAYPNEFSAYPDEVTSYPV